MGLGVVDTPWFLAGCGVIVAAIGWFASGRFNERAALSSMAHVVWGDLSSGYQRLWEKSREGGNVADREIEEVEAQENMISALTRREFGEADRRLVVESEEECYKFFGVRPSAEKDSAGSSLQEEHAS